MAQQKIYHLTSSINIEELQQIAILIHQLNILELEKTLWTHYYKSGTGTLKVNDSNLKVWSSNIKKMIQSNQIKVDDDHCLKFVSENLRELNEKHHEIQQQLIIKKKQFVGYTITIDEILQAFIREHLKSLRLKYECKIKLVDFDYRERVLEHAFLQENPIEQQVIIIIIIHYSISILYDFSD